MTRTLNISSFESAELSANTFNVLIAYENIESGKQAKNTYDFLVEKLGGECQFTSQMWKFEVLNIPQLRELAVKDASKADIIIIACHGDKLPFEVKAWIELWLSEPHHPFALVGMFDSSGKQSYYTNEVRRYLADVAKRGEMEFFAQPDEFADNMNVEPFRFQAPPTFLEFGLSVEKGLKEQTNFPRWGINE
jgi:hypothetical protein